MAASFELDGHGQSNDVVGRQLPDWVYKGRKEKMIFTEGCHAGRRADSTTTDTVPLTFESLILQEKSSG